MIDERMDFTGKTAIITGAASGMGEAASREIARRGGAVVMADINGERAEEIAREIRSAGGRAAVSVTDVRKYEDICRAVDLAVSEFGSADITISFAGGEPARMLKDTHDFPEQSVELIDWGLQVNGRAPVYMARAVLPQMIRQRRGVIINISSVTGIEGGAVVYAAAKSALIGFTKAIAGRYAQYGIRCCCVAPGPVLSRPQMANMKTAIGRAATVDEMVGLVLYLASDNASFITGTTYLADCGRTCLLA